MSTRPHAPLLRTKICPPPPPAHLVPRPHLLQRLQEGLAAPLTLISAPAGFGKTTLVSAWLQRQTERSRVAWLSLDENDNDPIRFLDYLVAALQQVEPGVGHAPVLLLRQSQMPAPRDLMTLLLNELGDTAAELTLVLNDYQVIDNPEIDAALSLLVEHAPARFRLIITSRASPNLPLARWRTLLRISEFDLEDLRFSLDEAAQFLQQAMGLQLNVEAVRALEQRTEGWVAGLQMAALSLQHRSRSLDADQVAQAVSAFDGQHRYVIDFLAAEVLRQQPEEVHAFLRQTAVLDRLCAPLCDALTGREDSGQMLARLDRANMFLLALDQQRHWYRFHHLFGSFLRSVLAPADQRALHQRASAWYEANGLYQEAMKHALAAADVAAAVRLFRAQAEQLFSRGEISTLLGWLEALPDGTVQTHSDLCGYQAWLLFLRGHTLEAREYVALSQGVDHQALGMPQRGMLLTFQAYLALNWGDPKDAIAPARQALALLEGRRSFFSAYALSFLAQAQSACGERREAVETLRQAVRLGQRLGSHLVTLDALLHLAPLMYAQGQLREAVVLCRTAIAEYVDGRGKPLPVAGLVHVSLGVLYYELDQLALAREYLAKGIVLCQRLGMVYYTLMGQRGLAKLQHLSGEREAAWNTLAAARELAQGSENPGRWRSLAVLGAELQLREGNVAAARRALAELGPPAGSSAEYQRMTAARLLLAQNQGQRSEEALGQLQETASHDGRAGSLIAIHVLQALCRQAAGDRRGARERLRHALSLAASAGYRRVFLDEGSALVPLLAEAREAAPDYAEDLLMRFAAAATTTARREVLVEPLSQAQLHILRLLERGHSNREIAQQLAITVGTAKWHLSQMFGKLQVHNRTAALARARDLRLL